MAKKRVGSAKASDSRPRSQDNINSSSRKSSGNRNYNSTLAERVQALADCVGGKGLLATAIGVSAQMVSRYLSDNPPMPGLDVLERMHNATGCDPAWLLTGKGEPFPTVQPESAEGRQLLGSTREELLIVVDHLGLALESLGPMLSPEERDEIELSLERLAPRFRGDAGD